MTTTSAKSGKAETCKAEISKPEAKPDLKTETKTKAKPSPVVSRAKAREGVKTVTPKRPTTLDGARKEMRRLICVNSAAITQALIDNALQGSQLQAKFLFELAGLSAAAKGDDLDEATQRETLASFLLTRWQLETQDGQKQDGTEQNGPESDEQVTEVAEVTPDLAGEAKAPVEL